MTWPGTSTIKQSAVTLQKILSWPNLAENAQIEPGLCQMVATKNAEDKTPTRA